MATTDEAITDFLASFHFTPHDSHSPAELTHGRQPRTLLHIIRPSTSHQPSATTSKFSTGTPIWVRRYGKHQLLIQGCILEPRGCTAARDDAQHINQLQKRVLLLQATPPAFEQGPLDMDVDIAPLPAQRVPPVRQDAPIDTALASPLA